MMSHIAAFLFVKQTIKLSWRLHTLVDRYLDILSLLHCVLCEGGRGGQLCHCSITRSEEQEAEPRIQQHQVSI